MRAERRAQITQQRYPRLQNIGNRPQRLCRLGPDRAMIGLVRRVQRWLAFGKFLPVEIATINDHPANRCAMPADIFGQRMHDNRRPMVKRARQNRRGGVVEDQRNAPFAPKRCHLGNRKHLELRVRQCLAIIGPGACIRCPGEILRVGRVDKAHFDALIGKRVLEQIIGATVKIGRADDIIADMRQILHGKG